VNPASWSRPYLPIVLLVALLWFMKRAAGRLAPRVAIAPAVFLVTRTPVLLAWGVGAAGMFALLIPGALEQGHSSFSDLLLISGLSAFCGLGFAALSVGPIWAVVRAFAATPVFPLQPGEILLREIVANHFLGGEARGGKLLVTTRRLGFRPHRFNVQLTTWSVPLESVRDFDFEGDRFLLVGVKDSPNAEWIVVPGPRKVAEYIGAVTQLPEGARANSEVVLRQPTASEWR
jgi:hypothetical protein